MPVIQSAPEEFFGEALDSAIARVRVSVSVFARRYLVQLLVRQIEQGCHPSETLGDRFALAGGGHAPTSDP